jgi:phosphoribosyl-AMP cyclohydrolase
VRQNGGRGRLRLATDSSCRYADPRASRAAVHLNPHRCFGDHFVKDTLQPMANQPATIPDFSRPDGLVTVVAQDATTREVLMVAHMNREAWDETLKSGRAVYFSRSRGQLWRKGEESGNVQHVRSVRVDCDGDAVLLVVEQVGGAACHEGYASCFFREATAEGLKVIGERVFDPAAVYGKTKE